MITLIARRLFLGLFTLFALTFIMFAAVESLPGDACTAYLGRSATEASLAKCHAEHPIEGALVTRYAVWAGQAMTGDLGQSLVRETPVSDVVALRFRNTLVLAIAAALFSFPLAIALGVLAALRRDSKLDLILSTTALTAMSIPEFVSATALVLVFSIWIPILPGISIVPPDAPVWKLVASITTPAIALALISVAHVLRMVRTCVVDVLASPYVRMARLRGVPERRIVWRHVLPNAMLPAISLIALQFAWLLGGVVVIEVVFNYPGLGRLTVDAVSDRDLPLVLGIATLLAAIYVLVNILADVVMLLANPRLRTLRG